MLLLHDCKGQNVSLKQLLIRLIVTASGVQVHKYYWEEKDKSPFFH